VQLLKDLGLDGLDIDWEYPQDDTQASNFVLLLQECRKAMDDYAKSVNLSPKNFLLTVACPAGAQNYQKLHLSDMDKYLDFWNLMAYDYSGSWDANCGHQANLHRSISNPVKTPFNTDDAIAYYTSNGVSASKIVLGMPLYGRAFQACDGPGNSFSGVGEGSWESGVWDYKVLPQAGAMEQYDQEAGATWSFDPAKKLVISYDNTTMAQEKARYIKSTGLGGGMWWESSGDGAGDGSIISAVVDTFGSLESSENTLEYPASKYDNLRGGMN
jgi:chitinase